MNALTGDERSRLYSAFVERGLSDGKARAAVRLVDGVKFDGGGAPVNLDTAIESAEAIFGAEQFERDTLPPDEAEFARKAGMSRLRYEELKDVSTFEDWQRAEGAREARGEDDPGRDPVRLRQPDDLRVRGMIAERAEGMAGVMTFADWEAIQRGGSQ